jgi:hypothetical protein
MNMPKLAVKRARQCLACPYRYLMRGVENLPDRQKIDVQSLGGARKERSGKEEPG